MPADKAQRYADLQVVAGCRLQPKCLNSRFRDDLIDAILPLDHALRGNQPGCVGSEKIRFTSIGSVQRQIHPIEAIRVRPHVQGLWVEMRVVNFDEQKEEALGRAGL